LLLLQLSLILVKLGTRDQCANVQKLTKTFSKFPHSLDLTFIGFTVL